MPLQRGGGVCGWGCVCACVLLGSDWVCDGIPCLEVPWLYTAFVLHPVPIWFGFFFCTPLRHRTACNAARKAFKKKISKNNNSHGWFPYSKKGKFLCTSTPGLYPLREMERGADYGSDDNDGGECSSGEGVKNVVAKHHSKHSRHGRDDSSKLKRKKEHRQKSRDKCGDANAPVSNKKTHEAKMKDAKEGGSKACSTDGRGAGDDGVKSSAVQSKSPAEEPGAPHPAKKAKKASGGDGNEQQVAGSSSNGKKVAVHAALSNARGSGHASAKHGQKHAVLGTDERKEPSTAVIHKDKRGPNAEEGGSKSKSNSIGSSSSNKGCSKAGAAEYHKNGLGTTGSAKTEDRRSSSKDKHGEDEEEEEEEGGGKEDTKKKKKKKNKNKNNEKGKDHQHAAARSAAAEEEGSDDGECEGTPRASDAGSDESGSDDDGMGNRGGMDISDSASGDEQGKADRRAKPASSSSLSSGKRKRSVPKKHDSIMSKQAAMGMLASLNIPAPRMKDYVCAKVFNAFSCGMYFKFLTQCRAADEAWAFDVQSSISNVQKLNGMLTCVVNTLKQAEERCASISHGDEALNAGPPGAAHDMPRLTHAVVCTMSSTSPPVRRRVEHVKAAISKGLEHAQQVNQQQQQQQQQGALCAPLRCCITGSVLEDECLELKPAGKAQGGMVPAPAALVRVDFEHFFTMLWFCYKIDHVIRQFAKCWMDDVMEKGQACAAADEGCDNGKDGGEDDCLIGSTHGRGAATSNTGVGKGGGTGEISDPAPSAKCENVAVDETIHKQSVSLGVMAFEQSRDGVPDEPGALNMQALCEKFSKDCDETISCMHKVFMHGYAHVIESIYSHLPVVQFLEESDPPVKKRSGSGKPDANSKPHGGRESSSKKARKEGGPAPEASAVPCAPPKCKGVSVKGSKEATKKRPSSIDEKVVASEASISKKSHKKKRPEVKPQCLDSDSDEE
jgi:hypothetical protein